METLLSIRFLVSAVYLAATVAYVLLLRSGRRRSATATSLLGVGLGLHLAEVLARGAEAGAAGGAPFATRSGFLSIFAFLLGATYFLLERRYRRHRIASLGAFHVPVLFALQLGSVILKQPVVDIPRLNRGLLFVCHVVPTIFAYAALTAGFVAGIAFLLLDRQLKNKRFDMLVRGLPSLDLVERVNASATRIGLPLVALGGALGLAMGYAEWGWGYRWDLKVWMTIAIVAIFSAQLGLRRFAGWHGRRSILVSIVGFVAIVVNVTVMNILYSALHRL